MNRNPYDLFSGVESNPIVNQKFEDGLQSLVYTKYGFHKPGENPVASDDNNGKKVSDFWDDEK